MKGFVYLLKCLTGASICYILYKKIPQYPFYWAIVSVVVALTPDNSNRQAYNRMIANILGCTVGLILYPLLWPGWLLLCLGIITVIMIGYAAKIVDTLRSAMAALVIVLIHEEGQRSWQVPLERVLCVVAGCLIALGVTLLFNIVGRRLEKRPLPGG